MKHLNLVRHGVSFTNKSSSGLIILNMTLNIFPIQTEVNASVTISFKCFSSIKFFHYCTWTSNIVAPHFPIFLYFLLQMSTNYFLHQVIGSPRCHTMLSVTATGTLLCRKQHPINSSAGNSAVCVPRTQPILSLVTGPSRCFDLDCFALGFLTTFQAPEAPSNELLN